MSNTSTLLASLEEACGNILEAPDEVLLFWLRDTRETYKNIGRIVSLLKGITAESSPEASTQIDQKKFSLPIKALQRLSRTISYSDKYKSFAENILDITCEKIEGHGDFKDSLQSWHKLSLGHRQHLICSLRHFFATATTESYGIRFNPPKLVFFDEGAKYSPELDQSLITQGFFSARLTPKTNQKVCINKNKQSSFDDPVECCTVAFHECTHWIQFSLSWLWKFGSSDRLTRMGLEKDAKLWMHMVEEEAFVSHRFIRSVYKEQNHERDASAQDSAFKERLKQILDIKEGAKPPSLNPQANPPLELQYAAKIG